jgi:hypothetical protein
MLTDLLVFDATTSDLPHAPRRMERRRCSAIGCCLLTAILVGASAAYAGPLTLTNGNFEAGDLSGWTAIIPLGPWAIGGGFITPNQSFTLVQAGNVELIRHADGALLSISSGEIDMLRGEGWGPYDIVVSQTLSMEVGTVLTGWAQFFNGDPVHQDAAWVRIKDAAGVVIARPWVEYSGVDMLDPSYQVTVPWRQMGEWTAWNWEAVATAQYTLELGVRTSGDNRWISEGRYDNIAMLEPSISWPLVLSTLALFVRRATMTRNWRPAKASPRSSKRPDAATL